MASCPPLATNSSPIPVGPTMETELMKDLVGEWKRILESVAREVLTRFHILVVESLSTETITGSSPMVELANPLTSWSCPDSVELSLNVMVL